MNDPSVTRTNPEPDRTRTQSDPSVESTVTPDPAYQLPCEPDPAADTPPVGGYDSGATRAGPAPAGRSAPGAGPIPFIPGFVIEGVLGRGGMGVVYKARQLRLNRPVALKTVLAGGHADPRELARFLQEAEAVAHLGHPNIVGVYEAGRHNGVPYFAMEYVPGGALSARLKDGPLPPREAARVSEQVARGIAHAHARGILHRDLKPANVLLAEDGTPKVTDFGLAKRLDVGEGLTVSGAVMGTPSYMAPEQAAGKTRMIGPVTDVYGLGALLYELLTGRPPFRAATALETVLAVLEREPVPPSRLVPGVRKDLETVCLKCLEKSPDRRYPTAAAVADDLRRFLSGQPVLARPVSKLARAARWARRNPSAAAVALLTILLVLSAGGGLLALVEYRASTALLRLRQQEQELSGLRQQEQERVQREQRRAAVSDQLAAAGRLRAEGKLTEARSAFGAIVALIEADADAVDLTPFKRAALDELARVDGELSAKADLTTFRDRRNDVVYRRLVRGLFPASPHPPDDAGLKSAATGALAVFGLDRDPPDAARVAELKAAARTADERTDLHVEVQELLVLVAAAEAAGGGPDGLRRATAVLDRADVLERSGWPPLASVRAARRHSAPGPVIPERIDAQVEASPAALFARTLEAHERANDAAVAAAAERLLQLRPSHSWGRLLLAVAHLRGRRNAEANEGLNLCLTLDPTSHLARAYRVLAAGRLGHSDEADADCAAILSGCPDPTVRLLALYHRGLVRADGKHWPAAERDLRAALAIRPDVAEVHRTLAGVLVAKGDGRAAESLLTDGVRKFPAAAAAFHLDRGKVRLALRDRAGARNDFLAASAPESGPGVAPVASLELARMVWEDGGPDAAPAVLAAVDRLIARPDAPPGAHLLRARVLAGRKMYVDAELAVAEHLRAAGRAADPAAHSLHGLLLSRRGRWYEAAEAYKNALAAAPSAGARREITLARAGVYMLSRNYEAALQDYDAVLAVDPKDLDGLCGRAEVRVRRKELRAGLADADAVAARRDAAARHLCLSAHARAIAWREISSGTPEAAQQGYTQADADAQLAAIFAELRRSLDSLPTADRAAFWAEAVREDAAFKPLLTYEGMVRLESSIRQE